jgi:N-acetylglucosaminyldiphosphoundecaprenol N-acetyl-beta-D-mannosaminyltransferase
VRTVDIGGVPVGALTRAEWVAHLVACASGAGRHHHVSLNAAKWVAARRDPTLRRALREATSIGADGASILWAARRAGAPLPERAAGFDLATALADHAAAAGTPVALLGAAPPVLETVSDRLQRRGVPVVHARHGYFAPDEERAVAQAIGRSSPHLLFVAMGSPRTEHFVARWAPVLDVPLVMGVGGTFDAWAGLARRAPALVQDAGLEWAWRWLGSPRVRFRRAVLDSAAFVAAMRRGERLTEP